MLEITLYKNCILSNDYNEVFETSGTTLEKYLSTLQSFTTQQELVYMVNSGTFVFELTRPNNWSDIYEFNYMKVKQGNFVRYCFIDSIVIGNGIAYIDYSEDIWHSYAKAMNLRNSYLSFSLKLNYLNNPIKYAYLPLEYETNDFLNTIQLADSQYFYIVAQMQRYTLTTAGEVSNRINYTVCFLRKPPKTVNWTYTAQEVENELQLIANTQHVKQDDGYYYEFDNYTLIDASLFELYKYLNSTSSFVWKTGDTILTAISADIDLFKLITIEPDYTINSIGTLSSMFGVTNNGTQIKIEVELIIYGLDCKILLNYNGKIIDITNDFVITIPYTSLNGETLAQRKIAEQTQIKNGILSIANGVVDTAEGITNTENIRTGTTEKRNYSRITGKRTSTKTTYNRQQVYQPNVGAIQGGISGIVNGAWDISVATTPRYQNTYGAFVLGNKLHTALKGLCLFKIKPDNLQEVNNMINEVGYRVYEIVGNEVFQPTDKTNFDLLKFEFVKVFGSFPQDICNGLKEILLKGIKVWYTENV